MLVLGYAGHRRHGWKDNGQAKLRAHLKQSKRDPTVFDAIASCGDDPEDLPLNFFPLDGVGHDSAAAILRDGELVAAAAEERFNRFKHSTGAGGNTLAPRQAAEFCIAQAGASVDQVDHIAFYCDFTPTALRERIVAVEPHLSAANKTAG